MNNVAKRCFTYIIVLVFITSTCLFAVRPARAAGTVALINVADGSSNFNFTSPPKNVGDTFIANVTIADAVNLGTWQTTVSWNSALLGLVSITYPSDEVFAGKSPIRAPPFIDPGSILMGASAGPLQTGFTGNGRLAQLTFNITQAVGAGETVETDMQFIGIPDDTFLLDDQGNDITANYAFNVAHYKYSGPAGPAQAHDIAVANVAPASTSVIEGSSININVTVANTGNFTETFNVGVTVNGTSVAVNQTVTSLAAAGTETLTFTWNTTLFVLGSYNLLAAAGPVSGETNTIDNTRSGGVVQIAPPGADHDIQLVQVSPKNIAIGQGFILNISVIVANIGIFTETFDVAVFANGTQVASNQTVSTLNSGANVTLLFRWNTTGWTIGNYTLSATTSPILGDTDNTLVFESIYVMLRGDVNNDGVVNMKDIIDILNSRAFNAFSGTSRYKPYMDANADGRIDMRDILAIALNFNKHL